MYKLQVPVNRLQDGVDEDGLLGLRVGQQVGVGAALRLKELGEGKKSITGMTQQ